jgi:ADP-heptose:LPS heptosyltransferase/GT2 family glycosyltransferase
VRITIRGRGGELEAIHRPVRAIAAPGTHLVRDDSIKLFLDLPIVAASVATEPVRGSMSLVGWALSKYGIAGVEVLVDGTSLGDAHYGIRREDIHANFPDLPGSRLSGFSMVVPRSALKTGTRIVRVVARDKAGSLAEQEFSVVVEKALVKAGPWSLQTKLPQVEIDLDLAMLAAMRCHPQFELLLLIDRPASSSTLCRLRRTLNSLSEQVYCDWRLTLLSPTPISREQLGTGFEAIATKVTTTLHPALIDANAPTERPQLICCLSAGDELGEDALIELAIARAEQPDGDFFYSDERRRDPSDGIIKAFFKPDWSPDLLLSMNYIGRLWAAAPALLERAAIGVDAPHRYSEYDIVLRLTEHAQRIVHIPKVLCTGTAREGLSQQRRALERALFRRGIAAQVREGCLPGTYRIRRTIAGDRLVSIIIPTMAARGLIKVALESIRTKTTYRNFEIVCLDNISAADVAAKDYVRQHADIVIDITEPFNWSRSNNIGAKRARGEFLLFLNDDIEVLDGDWLTILVEQAERSEVGVVGPRLLYPDGRVQHAGMFLSRSVARHAFRFSPADEPGPFGLALSQRNVISVTGACMLIRRAAFEELGGFDESHTIINNDLDYCLRARQRGQLVVFVPQANLIHHEMASRSFEKDLYHKERFDDAWRDIFLTGDPYFSQHLNVDYDEYTPESEPLRMVHVGYPLVDKQRVRRILAVKLDHIGDFVAALPAFRRLKEHFPQAELWVLAATASLELAHLEPAIDKVIEFNFFHQVSSQGVRAVTKAELRQLQRHLAPLRFDLALDLRQQPETRSVLQAAGARWNAGFDYRDAASWLDIAIEWEGDTVRRYKRSHVSDKLLQLVDTVARACVRGRNVITSVSSSIEARTRASALPAVAPIAGALFRSRAVCMHIGAGSENKRWPVAAFAGLIDLLISHDGVNVVLVGGQDETQLAEQLITMVRYPEKLFCVVGKIGLTDLPALLRGCDLFVGNDSGPKHLAAALGVPTVGIHSGSVDPFEWGPVGPTAIALHRDMTCSPCYLINVSDCPRALACLHGIPVGDVYRVCRRMLRLRQQ